MSDEAAQPDDELAQTIRNAILAGAAEGAKATARRIVEAVGIGLDEVMATVQALAADAAPQVVTGDLSIVLPSASASVSVMGATASVSVSAPAGSVHVAPAQLSGEGTLVVSRGDVAAALSSFGEMGVDAADLGSQPPVRWTKQDLVLNTLVVLAVVYWLLPPAAQQFLLDMATLVTAVAAVMPLLKS